MSRRSEQRQTHQEHIFKYLGEVLEAHQRRDANPELKQKIIQTSAWHSQRIGKTYSDIAVIPRFHDAVRYFQNDMYGPKDYAQRDRDVQKIYPIIEKLLPNRFLEILTHVMELNALTMQLDEAQALALQEMSDFNPIEADAYAQAYRVSAPKADRAKQIDLVLSVGEELNQISGKSYLGGVLKLSKKPAHKLGIGDLHSFLDNGYRAFMKMKDATPFINTIRARETQILDNIFDAVEQPFDIPQHPIQT